MQVLTDSGRAALQQKKTLHIMQVALISDKFGIPLLNIISNVW